MEWQAVGCACCCRRWVRTVGSVVPVNFSKGSKPFPLNRHAFRGYLASTTLWSGCTVVFSHKGSIRVKALLCPAALLSVGNTLLGALEECCWASVLPVLRAFPCQRCLSLSLCLLSLPLFPKTFQSLQNQGTEYYELIKKPKQATRHTKIKPWKFSA